MDMVHKAVAEWAEYMGVPPASYDRQTLRDVRQEAIECGPYMRINCHSWTEEELNQTVHFGDVGK